MFVFNITITADAVSILEAIRKSEERIMINLDRLEAAVTGIKDASDSIEALLKGVAQQLRDLIAASGDLAGLQNRINDMATTLETEAAELAAAALANTTPPPAPPGTPPGTTPPTFVP